VWGAARAFRFTRSARQVVGDFVVQRRSLPLGATHPQLSLNVASIITSEGQANIVLELFRCGQYCFSAIHHITYAKAAPSETMIARLVSMDDAGGERLLGEYTFNHTRSLPSPVAWSRSRYGIETRR
jgi:hypothetical protein